MKVYDFHTVLDEGLSSMLSLSYTSSGPLGWYYVTNSLYSHILTQSLYAQYAICLVYAQYAIHMSMSLIEEFRKHYYISQNTCFTYLLIQCQEMTTNWPPRFMALQQSSDKGLSSILDLPIHKLQSPEEVHELWNAFTLHSLCKLCTICRCHRVLPYWVQQQFLQGRSIMNHLR